MKYLPFDDFNIITPLTPAAVEERLLKEMEPFKFPGFSDWFYKSSGPYFSGYVLNGEYKLQPVIPGFSLFLPQITVVILPLHNGSRVHIKMQIRRPVVIGGVVCLYWFGVTGISEASTRHFGLAALFILALCLFAYLLTMFCFKPDARDAKARLLKILNGKIEE